MTWCFSLKFSRFMLVHRLFAFDRWRYQRRMRSKLHIYDNVVERVASHLSLNDPFKIRLTSHNCYSQYPKPQPIKYHGAKHLSGMPVHYNETLDILYYKLLYIPLPKLQGLKTIKVAFHHASKDEVVIHTIGLGYY